MFILLIFYLKALSYTKVNEAILKNNSLADNHFLQQFVQTQTFTHFLEQHYEIKI